MWCVPTTVFIAIIVESATTMTVSPFQEDNTSIYCQGDEHRLALNANEVYRDIIVVSYIIFAVCGSLANSFTLFVIIRYQRPLSIQNILVTELLITNLLTCGYTIPMLVFEVGEVGQQIGHHLCVFSGFILYFLTCFYLTSLLHISLHRYFMISHPHSKLLTFGSTKRTCVIICVSLGILISYYLPSTMGVWGKFGYVKAWGVCTNVLGEEGGSASFRLIGYIVATVLPLTTIILCYGRIIYIVWRKSQKIRNAANEGSKSENEEPAKRHKQTLNLTRTSMLIAFLFITCNVPLFLVNFIELLQKYLVFNAFATAIYMFHVVTYPVIYAVGDKKIRQQIVKMLNEVRRKKNNTSGNGTSGSIQL